ncbi:hypothetical protein J5893_00240 [bacterium]|nr:hypothetical protein [bacterium]
MRKISFLLLLGYFFVFSAVSSAGLSFTLNSEIFPDELDSTVWANMFSPIAFKVAGNYYPGAFLFRDLETDSISFAPSDYPVITG